MKITHKSGKYKLTRKTYPKGLYPSERQFIGPTIEEIILDNVSSSDAKFLFKFYERLGFDEIEYFE